VLELAYSSDENGLATGASIDSDSTEYLEQLASHFERLFHVCCTKPKVRVSTMSLLTDEEKQDLIGCLTGPILPYCELAISELFEEVARTRPNTTAVICEGRRISFDQLNQDCNRLARYLRRQGVEAGDRIVVCLDPSIYAITAVLAVLKAGGVYVPLSPDQLSIGGSDLLDDCGAKVIITTHQSAFTPCAEKVQVVFLDTEQDAILEQTSANLSCEVNVDSPAYVMYTSGSTGHPVGVVGIQRSIVNGIGEAQFDPLDPSEVCCLSSPLHIGISLLLLFAPLLSGVPLLVLTQTEMRDSIILSQAVARYQVTTLGLATPMLRAWTKMKERIAPSAQLKSVLIGGSSADEGSVAHFRELFPSTRLENGYGCTEAGSIVTRTTMRQECSNIGLPIRNTRVYVVDRYGHLAPKWAVGEIWVSSQHLAQGYLNNPTLSRVHFCTNPFDSTAKTRVFKSGDLGRFIPSTIQLLGRLDEQVKIRGYRVNLVQIDNALLACTGVHEGATTTFELDGEIRLASFVVRGSTGSISEVDLRSQLRSKLPEYMVPTRIIWVERLPVTVAGKLDRASLTVPPSVDSEPRSTSGEHNEHEAFVLDAWQDVLSISNIRLSDHFLDVGGDSLFAVAVTSRIWERYGLDFTIEEVFNNPTISALANEIQRRLSTSACN
jgi:amino acid adenylation domain-containing protein